MAANIELYEALKDKVGEDAARMIADIVPGAAELATKADVARLEQRLERGLLTLGTELRALDAKTTSDYAKLDAKTTSDYEKLDTRITSDYEKLNASIASAARSVEAALGSMRHEVTALIERSSAQQGRAMLAYFIPLWGGVFGVLAALLVKFVQ